MTWAGILALVGGALTAAEDAAPLVKDVEDLMAAWRGSPSPTATPAVVAALEPQIATDTEAAAAALQTPVK